MLKNASNEFHLEDRKLFSLKDISSSRVGPGLLPKYSDTDQRILEAYHLQCLAEAQEGITLFKELSSA